jgi:hypothetical protein
VRRGRVCCYSLLKDRGLTIVWIDSIFGFLLGSTISGAGLYYYVVDEYRVSNELLTEDVYVSLQGNPFHPRIEHSTNTIESGAPICRPEARGLRQGS